jgi:hypothetical protein
MTNELRPHEVAKMIEESCGPVELEVWNDNGAKIIDYVSDIVSPSRSPFYTEAYGWWQHARLPQKPERRKITDRYRLMKRCRELDAQGNGILVRWGSDSPNWDLYQGMCWVWEPSLYQYTHLDDNGHPTGEPQDFWE